MNTAVYKQRAKSATARTRENNLQNLREYISRAACVDCGLEDPTVLEFDHHDPRSKSADVSRPMSQAQSWSRIVKEMANATLFARTATAFALPSNLAGTSFL